MKKTNVKASKNIKSAKPTTPKVVAKKVAPKKTISSLVLNEFKTNPTIKSKEMIELVKKFNPESKFNVYHFCWYRYQIKKGRYNKQFDKSQLEKIFAK
jgi:hypothetical protein